MADILSLPQAGPGHRRRTPCSGDEPRSADAERADPIHAIPGIGDAEEFPVGITLFHQGHRPTLLWYIESGLVKTIRTVGETDAFVSPREPGWIVGLAPAHLKMSYSTSGTTARPSVLRSIQPMALFAAMEQSAALTAKILERVFLQARRDEIERAEMAVYSTSQRLVRALARFATMIDAPRRQGRVELVLPITNRELAQYVGTSRQHLGRTFAAFEASGKLIRRKGVLLLPLERWPSLATGRSHAMD